MRRVSRLLPLALASGVLLPARPVRAQATCAAVVGNLVQNCGFEGGTYVGGPRGVPAPVGYTVTGTNGGGVAPVVLAVGQSGFFAVVFADPLGASATLAQVLTTATPGPYQVSFFAHNNVSPGAPPGNEFAVTFGGVHWMVRVVRRAQARARQPAAHGRRHAGTTPGCPPDVGVRAGAGAGWRPRRRGAGRHRRARHRSPTWTRATPGRRPPRRPRTASSSRSSGRPVTSAGPTTEHAASGPTTGRSRVGAGCDRDAPTKDVTRRARNQAACVTDGACAGVVGCSTVRHVPGPFGDAVVVERPNRGLLERAYPCVRPPRRLRLPRGRRFEGQATTLRGPNPWG